MCGRIKENQQKRNVRVRSPLSGDVSSARARDNALREPYLSHSKYMMVDNSCKNFEEKISKAIGLISSVVGLPTDT